jgi:molybdate transport system substrate-binding protein
MRSRRVLLICAAAASAALLGGCAQQQEHVLTVLAAASLHEPFEELSESYTAETGVVVELRTAGSSGLVDQLENGAPGDVLATADHASMAHADQAGLLGSAPAVFAQNHLVLVTPANNPAQIRDLGDLANGPTVTLCAVQVPCGAAAARLLESAGVALSPSSEELSVTDVLGRVRTGEADAGLVYITSALQAREEVHIIPIEGAAEDPNSYPAAVLETAELPDEAHAFVEHLLSEKAQRVLADAGFARVNDS